MSPEKPEDTRSTATNALAALLAATGTSATSTLTAISDEPDDANLADSFIPDNTITYPADDNDIIITETYGTLTNHLTVTTYPNSTGNPIDIDLETLEKTSEGTTTETTSIQLTYESTLALIRTLTRHLATLTPPEQKDTTP